MHLVSKFKNLNSIAETHKHLKQLIKKLHSVVFLTLYTKNFKQSTIFERPFYTYYKYSTICNKILKKYLNYLENSLFFKVVLTTKTMNIFQKDQIEILILAHLFYIHVCSCICIVLVFNSIVIIWRESFSKSQFPIFTSPLSSPGRQDYFCRSIAIHSIFPIPNKDCFVKNYNFEMIFLS